MRTLAIFLLLTATASAQYIATMPRVLVPYENAVCRVTTTDRHPGAKSHGSGVLLETPATHQQLHRTYVLTANHVLSDRDPAQPVLVTWDGATYFRFSVAAARPGCDSALLKLDEGQAIPATIPRVPIATQEITLGEAVYTFGFGDATKNVLRCSGGKVVEFNQTRAGDRVWFAHAGQMRQGDSGGPMMVVRDGKVFVIGNQWGTSYDREFGHWTNTGNRLRVLHRLLGYEKAPVGSPGPRGFNYTRAVPSGSS